MANLILVHTEGVFRQNRTVMALESEDVTLDEFTNMQKAFDGKPKNGYSIPYRQLKDLIDDTLVLKKTNFLIGLIILPGKNALSDEFKIVLEPLFYKKSGKIVNEILPLTGDDYFGLSSANQFSQYYKGKEGREITRGLISKKDDKPNVTSTHAILIDNNWVIKLQKLLVIDNPIDLFFGRDTDSKLTMILAGRITDQLHSELYLDQHDLIPPPDPTVLA